MSITKYANFNEINNKTQNEGKYLQSEDLFIVSKNELDETDFGDCKYDIMEVSVYDINNNLLPHKSGKNIAYIKTGDIKNYLYVLNNKQGFPEMAIDAEKLLNELGFTNGILKLNINFVRNKVGSDNELTRVWIQEISPSREEVRIIPLKTKDESINVITTYEFKNIHNLSKDFKYYKRNILDALDKFESDSLSKIDDALVAKFGNDFRATMQKDFGLRDVDTFNKRIFDNFRDSIKYWLNNRYYDISQSNFGKPSEIRFIDCDQYSFNTLMNDISNILNNCISYNIKTLKRRAIDYTNLPKEFAVVELRKQIQDNLNSFQTNVDIKRNVYAPDVVDLRVQGTTELTPIKTVVKIEKPIKVIPPPVIIAEPPRVQAKAYSYFVSNGSASDGRSGFTNSFGYTDADGVSRVSISLSPGASTYVCAQQGSIRAGGPGWTVIQNQECNPTPLFTGGGGGGGIYREVRDYNSSFLSGDRVEQQFQ
jgi:hypothetical protein